MFKYSTLLILLLCLHLQVLAQKDSLRKKGVEPGAISINVGIAASTIPWTQGGEAIIGSSGVVVLSVSPAYNCTIDYNFTSRSSIGICGAYQQLSIDPASGDETIWGETDNDSRLNIALRYLLHYSKRRNHDAYIGFRSGVSYWTEDKLFASPVYNGPTTQAFNYYSAFSMQFLFGYRTYFTKGLGIHIELALGTPYYAEGGLAIRLNTLK